MAPLGEAAAGVEDVLTGASARSQLGVVDDKLLAFKRPGAHVARNHDLIELEGTSTGLRQVWGRNLQRAGHWPWASEGVRGAGCGRALAVEP